MSVTTFHLTNYLTSECESFRMNKLKNNDLCPREDGILLCMIMHRKYYNPRFSSMLHLPWIVIVHTATKITVYVMTAN